MWKRHLWIRIVHVSSFILLKTQYFLKNTYKIGLLKQNRYIRAKNVNKYRAVVILLLLVMSVKMVPYWVKVVYCDCHIFLTSPVTPTFLCDFTLSIS